MKTAAKSPTQGLGGAGHSGGGDRRRGPQGGQGEKEGWGLSQRQHPSGRRDCGLGSSPL